MLKKLKNQIQFHHFCGHVRPKTQNLWGHQQKLHSNRFCETVAKTFTFTTKSKPSLTITSSLCLWTLAACWGLEAKWTFYGSTWFWFCCKSKWFCYCFAKPVGMQFPLMSSQIVCLAKHGHKLLFWVNLNPTIEEQSHVLCVKLCCREVSILPLKNSHNVLCLAILSNIVSGEFQSYHRRTVTLFLRPAILSNLVPGESQSHHWRTKTKEASSNKC